MAVKWHMERVWHHTWLLQYYWPYSEVCCTLHPCGCFAAASLYFTLPPQSPLHLANISLFSLSMSLFLWQILHLNPAFSCASSVHGEVMWPPWTQFSYWKVEMIISIVIARLLQPWEGLFSTRGLKKSPQPVRYYIILLLDSSFESSAFCF